MAIIKVTDSKGKTWNCDFEVDGIVIVVNPIGYNKQWPFKLTKDETFVNNVKEEFKKMGMTKNVRQYNKDSEDSIGFIGDGVKELANVFKKKSKPSFRDVFKY